MAKTTTEVENLVVIGASAGGIEALSTFVASLTAAFPAPILIAQHVDPNRPSHLTEILSRRSPLPVHTVPIEGEEALKAGEIYLIPSNFQIELSRQSIKLSPDVETRPTPSVDSLLCNAAKVFGENLIAVILTGTGSDGAMGAAEVKKAGGTVVIQNPATASFPGMPSSLAPDTVDIVAELARIGPLLQKILTDRPHPESTLQSLLADVRERTQIDFSQYKPATIQRRLARRVAATETLDLDGYRDYLQSHPEEYSKLVSSFLIKVTKFQRDPELFEFLKTEVLPKLIEEARNNGKSLRIWSAGCATGEEAYTLAILLAEVLGGELDNMNIRIFATDLDRDAVAFARRGTYTAQTLQSLPPEWIERHFVPNADGNTYQIKKQLRFLTVFGEHDLGQRAPFPHLDLILCRNVMIYFAPELQRRALQLFAFSLRLGGFLVLGKTETAKPMDEFFTPFHTHHRIYRRSGQRMSIPPLSSFSGMTRSKPPELPRFIDSRLRLTNVRQELSNSRDSIEDLLKSLPVGVILVDPRYDILEINAAARRLLRIYSPAIGEDLIHAIQGISHRLLRGSIDTAFSGSTPAALEEVSLPGLNPKDSKPSYSEITCFPREVDSESGYVKSVLVLVHDVTKVVEQRAELLKTQQTQASKLEEMQNTIQQLQQENAVQTETLKELGGESGLVAGEDKKSLAQLKRRVIELQKASGFEVVKFEELKKANRQLSERLKHVNETVERLTELNSEIAMGNDQLTKANEELRHTNDEFLVAAEEAQASTEEAETLGEEVQAGNEELETLNEELQASVEELNTTNADLESRSQELEATARVGDQERIKLASVLYSMNDALVAIDQTGKVVLCNKLYTRTFGTETVIEDEKGLPLPLAATPQARAAQGEAFRMVVSLPKTPRCYYEAACAPAHLAPDEPFLAVLTFRDVTASRLAEEALRYKKELLNSIVEGTTDAVFVIDKNGRYRLMNSAALECLGKKFEDVIGKDATALFPPNEAQALLEKARAVMAAGKIASSEELITVAGGKQLTCLTLKGPLFDADGNVAGMFGIVRDITERKQTILDLQETARSKDAFLAMLGHELRNPLAPIRNAAQILKMTGVLSPQAEQARVLIERQTTHLSRIVDDLLDVSRISRGKVVLRKERVDLSKLVQNIGDDYRSEIVSREIAFEVSVPPKPVWVDGDPTRLTQVLDNLLQNASKFTDAGGRIEVTLKTLPKESTAVMTVTDTGIGMSEVTLRKIFEPFVQAEMDIARSRGGLGLGLALVKGMLDLHGGSIQASSRDGSKHGSEFTVKLPMASVEKVEASNSSASVSVGIEPSALNIPPALRILIIEDNFDSAESLQMLLALEGHEVEVARNGRIGLEKAHRFMPNVVLCDIGLPGGMDGYEIARTIRLDPALREIHLIAMTGYGQDEDKRNAFNAGFNEHLTKPADPVDLEKLLLTVPKN